MNNFKIKDLAFPIHSGKNENINFRNNECNDQSAECAPPSSCKPTCQNVGSRYVDVINERNSVKLENLKKQVAKIQALAVAEN